MTSHFRFFSIAQLLRISILTFSTLILVACGGGAGTVGIPSGTSLFTNAPSAVTLNSGTANYTIGGGTATYKSSSSNTNVATTNVKGTTLSIVSVAAGTAQITVSDAAGASLIITVTVGGGTTPTDLFTTAPTSLTLAPNVSSSFTIVGGKPGYFVSSSNSAVATVAINGNSFLISGVAIGSALVHITDSTGASKIVSITVSSGGSGALLYTTAANSITINATETNSFTIAGGIAPYKASSSNTGVASVSVTGTALNIKGIATGTAQVLVFDASGTSVAIIVNIGSGGTNTNLFVTSASSVNIAVAASSTYTIGGGTAPYSVSSSNKAVTTASISGTTLLISGIAVGTAQVHVFDASGASVAITVNIGSGGTTTNFFTTSPSSVDIAVTTSNTYTVGGGVAPYTTSSSNTRIASANVAGTVLNINGIATGTAQVLVFDATGVSVTIAVNIGSGGTSTKFFTTSPNNVDIAVATSNTYTIGGGVAPYTASSSNTGVASVNVAGTVLNINGIATGTAQVLVFDATGAAVTINVNTGSSGTTTNLFLTSASSVTIAVAASSTYTIGGGRAPYSASSSNKAVATASVSGSTLLVSGIAAGTAQVHVFDASGAAVVITVNVGFGGTTTNLFTTAPSSIDIAVASSNTYTIGGGTPPYSVSSSGTGVVTASVSGTILSVNGIATGTAQVLVFDATGTSVPITVNIASGGTSTKLFTTSANSVNILVAASNTYTIGGGTAPYTVSSSNKSIATASVSGTSLLINGIAAGAAQVLVTDTVGASVSIDVTVSATASQVIDVQPNGATGNVGDVLQFLVSGASPAYTITVNNTSIATVSPASVATSGGSFSVTLLNAGSTTITIVDSLGQSKSFILTVSQLSTSLRLSPSALIIGEDSTTPIVLNIYGGAGPYRAFTSDQTLSSVSTSSASLTVALGTNSGRCINPIDSSGARIPNGTFDVIVTVLDSLGASATSTITIKDNGVGTGAIAPGAPPCL